MTTQIETATRLTRRELARLIDHTQVKAYATQVDITELCDEAARHGLCAVTVNPAWVSYCAKRLEGSGVLTTATIGFPLGANTALIKVAETEEAVRNGAAEIDVVINIGALKSGALDYVGREIRAVVQASQKAPVKVILETAYLSQEEKFAVCRLAEANGAAFVKTSTGFAPHGATVGDVRLMREAVATRLGTSAALEILADCPE